MKKEYEIYNAWKSLLDDLKEYADKHEGLIFEKEADFPDYIYRMQKEYDLPTHIMSASLSDKRGQPILLLSVSPRHALLKHVMLHPYESHVYRKLEYKPEAKALFEGPRKFTRERLFALADELSKNLSLAV